MHMNIQMYVCVYVANMYIYTHLDHITNKVPHNFLQLRVLICINIMYLCVYILSMDICTHIYFTSRTKASSEQFSAITCAYTFERNVRVYVYRICICTHMCVISQTGASSKQLSAITVQEQTAVYGSCQWRKYVHAHGSTLQRTATHCITLHHIASHYITLQ